MVTARTPAADPTMDGPQVDVDRRSVVGEWFDEHVDTIHRYVARRLGDELANDVTADTFRTALEHFDRFDPTRGLPIAWLYGIATNLIRRHWRTEQRRLRNQLRAADPTGCAPDPLVDVDGRVDASRAAARVVAAIERLDPADRDMIVLAAWEGLSSTEIAAALDVPASTVRARLQRIRARLDANSPGEPPSETSPRPRTTQHRPGANS